MNRRTLFTFMSLVLLVVLIGVPVLLTWRAARQERLNQALIAAIRRNNTQAVLSLLTQGTDANARNEPHVPVSFWQLLLHMLGRKHSTPSTASPALLVALSWRRDTTGNITSPENPVLIKALLDHGAKVNVADSIGWTPLIRAAATKKYDTAVLLLDHGANVNAQAPKYGFSAFSQAVSIDDTRLIDLLPARGADINIRMKHGTTPLMIAVTGGYTATVRTLLKHHADVNLKTKDGQTALYLAERGERVQHIPEIIRLLKQAGAKE